MASVRGNRFLRNTMGLYVAMSATYLGPLVTLAYVVRVLGHSTWGQLAFAQAFAAIAAAFVSYGFNLSGAREVARHRDDRTAVGAVLSDVSTSRLVLCAGVLIATAIGWETLSTLRGVGILLWLSVVSSMLQSSSLLWFYQGLQAVRRPVVLEVGARVASVVGIIALVRGPNDAWKVPTIQALAFACAVLVEYASASRWCDVRLAPLRMTPRVLRRAFGLFVFLVCSMIASQGTFFLGFLAAAPTVAVYAGAERIARGTTSLTGPLTQAAFARISGSVAADPSRAAFDARRLLGLMLALGSALSIVTYVLAPAFVRVLLGATYSGAIVPLQIMALIPALSAIGNALGVQWLVPLGHDRALGIILFASVPLIGALAYVLVPAFGVEGMAVAEVAIESFIALAIFVVTARMRLLPWQALRK